MTNQERDRFIYNNDTFGIVRIDGEGLFNPADCGIDLLQYSFHNVLITIELSLSTDG